MKRFIADAMLGGLARWLRVLGLDVAYEPGLDDAALVRRALAEERCILTRDSRLVRRRLARDHLLVTSERVEEQVREVLGSFGIAPSAAGFLSRCLRCNSPLVPMPAERALAHVPPHVARTQRRFAECPQCGRVYWAATHVRRMRERLRAMGLDGGA